MEENIVQNPNKQMNDLNQEVIMNKVDQTFNQFVQDVRKMLNQNEQQEKDE